MQADKDQPWKLAADQIKCRKDLVCVAASDDDEEEEQGSCLCCSKHRMQKSLVVTQHQMHKDLVRIILCCGSRCRREILVVLQHQMKKWSWKDLCSVAASSDEVQDQPGHFFLSNWSCHSSAWKDCLSSSSSTPSKRWTSGGCGSLDKKQSFPCRND